MQPNTIAEKGWGPALHQFDLKECLKYSEALQLAKESETPYLADKPVVLDGSLWVASDKPLVDGRPNLDVSSQRIPAIWSYDGEKIGRFTRRKKFILFKIGEDGLHPFSTEDLNKLHLSREEEKMAFGDVTTDLDKLLQEADQGGAPAGTPGGTTPDQMQQFDGNNLSDVGTTDLTKKSEITQDITKRVSGIKLGSLEGLHAFNQAFGRLVGWVTAQDSKVEFKVEQIPVKKDGQTELNAEGKAKPEVVEKHNSKKRVENKYLITEGHLKALQQKPGKILGAVVMLPEGGIVGFDSFTNTNVKVDTDKRALKHMLLTYAEFKVLVPAHFNGVISELEELHGDIDGKPFSTTVTATPGRVKDKNKALTKTPKASIRVATTRSGTSLINDRNYIPVKTFDTIRIDSELNQEQVDKLNFSMFSTLVDGSNVGRKKGENAQPAVPKYELLAPQFKALITKNPDNGTISSKYVTLDASNRVPVEVTPFWSKDADKLSSVEIPVKEKRRNEETGNESVRFKTFSAADEKVVAGPDGEKTSLKLPKFQAFLKAAGGVITQESLRALTSKSRGNAGGGKYVAHDDLIKLVYGSYSDDISEDVVQFADGAGAKALNARFQRLAVETAIS